MLIPSPNVLSVSCKKLLRKLVGDEEKLTKQWNNFFHGSDFRSEEKNYFFDDKKGLHAEGGGYFICFLCTADKVSHFSVLTEYSKYFLNFSKYFHKILTSSYFSSTSNRKYGSVRINWIIYFTFNNASLPSSSAKYFGHREHSIIGGGSWKPKYQYDLPGGRLPHTENHLEARRRAEHHRGAQEEGDGVRRRSPALDEAQQERGELSL